MRIVLATQWFGNPGGSETYLLTVAEQLTRLGHDATIHARELGDLAEFARSRGVPVASEGDLPPECDAVLAQDGDTAYALAARYPRTPQLFVAHSALFDLQAPPQLDGIASVVVTLNDRVERRMRAMASNAEVVRMRQPVDLRRFSPRGDIRGAPRRALLLGNTLVGSRYEMVVRACSELGIECERAGAHGDSELEPERLIGDADIVIGHGRCILEAMSCARAAFVYDHRGGHGWVTAESYPALEADGFTGWGTPSIFDGAGLRTALGEYRPEMGLANVELAQLNHSASRHASALAALLERLAPRSEPTAPLREMARLVRMSWQQEFAARDRELETWDLRRRANELEGENRQLRRRLQQLQASRRYRLGSLISKPLDLWRHLNGSYSHGRDRRTTKTGKEH